MTTRDDGDRVLSKRLDRYPPVNICGRAQVRLSGWGRTAPGLSGLQRITSVAGAVAAVNGAPDRGLIPRGLGRAYGDAAQNSGGVVLDLTTLIGVGSVDPDTGIVEVMGGTSLALLLHHVLPRGWFVPVVPGTRQVTVGGAVAGDVHGKNHHVDGTFSRHVVSLDLLTADGVVRTIGPDQQADLFWDTAGGMGLTGVILSVRLRLLKVETGHVLVETSRIPDLDALMAAMSDDDSYRYSAAWIDCLARGRATGRAVLLRGDHASVDQLPIKQRGSQAKDGSTALMAAPPWVPTGLLNRATVAAFNEAYFRRAPRHHVGPQGLSSFFFPLDALRGWNRLYGAGGLVQYQFAVPHGADEAVRAALERLSSARVASFLAVLKRFGAAGPGPLSFPLAGWTLAVDAPARTAGLSSLFRSLDDVVMQAGGRVYLSKDSRLPASCLEVMYPRLKEWTAVRRSVDPGGHFVSDLARRLGLA